MTGVFDLWFSDPMNLGTILCVSMWFAFAYNLVLGTFADMPWTRHNMSSTKQLPPRPPPPAPMYPAKPVFGQLLGIHEEQATRNLTAFMDGDVSKPVAIPVTHAFKYKLDIGPEFHDLGGITKAEVDKLLIEIERNADALFVPSYVDIINGTNSGGPG